MNKNVLGKTNVSMKFQLKLKKVKLVVPIAPQMKP